MKYEQRGTLALLLVASIAMAMLLTFGIRAMSINSQCEVSAVQCKYSDMILSAKTDPTMP